MDDADRDPEEVGKAPGRLVSASLRAIDAAARALQRLRDRLALVDDGEQAARGDTRNGRDAEEIEAAIVSAPRTPGLLRRILVVLTCLLLGGVAGVLLTYRGISKRFEGQERMIENMKDDIAQSKQDEQRSIKEQTRYQREIGDYRKKMQEASRELEEYRAEVDSLNKRLQEVKHAEALAGRSAPASRGSQTGGGSQAVGASKAGSPRPSPPPAAKIKDGTCVAGTANAAEDLTNCLKAFNRP